MPDDLMRDRVCLITGASRGLGAEIARAMARHGARVAVNYRRSDEAARQLCREIEVGGGEATPFPADVADEAEVDRLVGGVWEMLGPIDVLVNNAGPYVDTPFLDLDVADFDHVQATNVRATFLVTRAAGRRMKAQGRGTVVNVAATDAFHRSHSVYGLAKAGVIYLTEALALELAPEVRVNAVAPDLIADNEGMGPDLVNPAVAATPLGRLVTRAEIAETIYLLCASPTFDSMTGRTLVLDGGRSLPRIALGPDAAPG